MDLVSFSTLYSLISYVLISTGFWYIFGKCGIERKWWAFIPVFRLYKLSVCAHREEMGKKVMIATFFSYFLQVVYLAVSLIRNASTLNAGNVDDVISYGTDPLSFIILFSRLAVSIVVFIYNIRVYIGLTEVFGRRKRWIIGWILLEPLTALYWGLNRSFLPQAKTGEELDEIGDIAQFNLKKAEGKLEIDIRSRTVRDFLTTRELLKDIKLTVEPGNMVLLLGGSGAGKTTFVNAVTGYEKADATVLLNGRDVYREFESMKYDIGFVPQMDLIRYNDTVRKTVEDAALLKLPKEIGKKERTEKIENTLEIFGLGSVQNNLVGKQSGGQKKRTSIATEFVSDPSLFILDEPDSGLDGVLARDLMERLHAIAAKGKIVIVITHSPDRVIDLFDRVIILAKDRNGTGRLVYEGSVPDCRSFFSRDKMEDIVKMINRRDEGGEGMGDTLIEKFAEVRNERA